MNVVLSGGPSDLERDTAAAIERRLTLLATDRCWSDHLSELGRIRDGIHVVSYVGKDPASEFCREAAAAFSDLPGAIDDEIVELGHRLGWGCRLLTIGFERDEFSVGIHMGQVVRLAGLIAHDELDALGLTIV